MSGAVELGQEERWEDQKRSGCSHWHRSKVRRVFMEAVTFGTGLKE